MHPYFGGHRFPVHVFHISLLHARVQQLSKWPKTTDTHFTRKTNPTRWASRDTLALGEDDGATFICNLVVQLTELEFRINFNTLLVEQ